MTNQFPISQQGLTKPADARLERARNDGGQFLMKMSDEDWDEVITRIEAGEVDTNIALSFGIHPSTINRKRERDPEFEQRYWKALENAALLLFNETELVSLGVEGFSTGSERRDEMVCKYRALRAERLVARLSPRMAIDQRQTIQIVVAKDDYDL